MPETPPETPAPATPQITREDVEAIVAGRLQRHTGTAPSPDLIRLFADEAEKTAQARRELAALREQHAAAVPEGARVLAPGEAAAYDALVSGHDSLDAAMKARVAASEPAKQLAALRRREALSGVTDADGRALNVDLFDSLAQTAGLSVTRADDGSVTAEVDGKAVPLADHLATLPAPVAASLWTAPAPAAPPRNPGVPAAGPAATSLSFRADDLGDFISQFNQRGATA